MAPPIEPVVSNRNITSVAAFARAALPAKSAERTRIDNVKQRFALERHITGSNPLDLKNRGNPVPERISRARGGASRRIRISPNNQEGLTTTTYHEKT